MLTLKDVAASKTISVPPAGVVLGREGGDADITVRDKSVSKHHARLYAMDGEWWIEDLNSANGTYVDDQRITGPVPLGQGSAFTLSNYAFEVMKIAGSNGASAGGGNDDEPQMRERSAPRTRVGSSPLDDDGFAEPTAPPEKSRPGNRNGGSAPAKQPRQPAPSPSGTPAPRGAKGKSAPPPPAKGKGRPAADVDDDFAPSGTGDGEGWDADPGESLEGGFGTAITQLPKAVAYYMATVPLLLLNPPGTIRKSHEDQKLPAMKGFPLMGWGIPAFVVIMGAATIFSIVAQIIMLGHTGFGGIVTIFTSAIVGIITMVVGGIVGGLIIAFLYHPIFKFFVEKLFGGKTNDKSRTNYLPISMAASILVVLPSGLTVLLQAIASYIPVAAIQYFISIPGIIIGAAGSILSLYIMREWMKFFETKSWVPLVLLIGMIATGGFGAFNSVMAIKNAVMSVVNGGGGSSFAGGGTSGGGSAKFALTAEQKAMLEKLTPEQRAQVEKGYEQAFAAQQAAMAGTSGGTSGTKFDMSKLTADQKAAFEKMTPDQRAQAEKAYQMAWDAQAAAGGTGTTVAATPKETPVKTAVAAATPRETLVASRETPVPVETSVPLTAVGGGNGTMTAYGKFAERRAAIEKAVSDDPTILKRDGNTFNLYRNLHVAIVNARKANAGKAGGDELLLQHLVDADIFDTQQKTVDDLYMRVRGR